MTRFSSAHRRTLTLAAVLAAAALIVAGCSKKSTSVLEPNSPDVAGIKSNGGGELTMATAGAWYRCCLGCS